MNHTLSIIKGAQSHSFEKLAVAKDINLVNHFLEKLRSCEANCFVVTQFVS